MCNNCWRRYVLQYIKSNMYVLVCENSAIVIDPHISTACRQYLQDNGVDNIVIILTHEHFDHTSGVNYYRNIVPKVHVIAHRFCAEKISIARNNRPLALLKLIDGTNRTEVISAYNSYDILPIIVDEIIYDKYALCWKGHDVDMLYVPGHSKGSILVVVDNKYLFSGDYLIPKVPVILRYPGGSEDEYQNKTLPILRNLSNGLIVMPGHGESYVLGG